jgi:lauroyl/myristoyl acyltransferase
MVRTKKRIGLYEQYIMGDRPLPKVATNASPGREEKIRVMIARLRRGEALHHPDDKRTQEGETHDFPAAMKRAEPVRRAAHQTGVERFGSYYRVRPFYQGQKRDLGIITKDEKTAVAAAEAFWRQVFGLFAIHAEQMKEMERIDRQIKRRQMKQKQTQQKRRRNKKPVVTFTQATLF